MYYITNHSGHVIAASSDLLKKLDIKSIDMLYKQIALDVIEFITEENGIRLKTALDEISYHTEKETLSSVLGEMTLVHLLSEEASSQETSLASLEEGVPLTEDFSLFENDEDTLFSVTKEEEEPLIVQEEKAETTLPIVEEKEEELFSLLEEEEPLVVQEEKAETTLPIVEEKEEELFSLLEEEEPLVVQEEKTETTLPIVKEKEEELFSLLEEEEPLVVQEEKTETTLPIVEEKEEELFSLLEEEEPLVVQEEKTETTLPIVEEKEEEPLISLAEEEKEDNLSELILPSHTEESINSIEDSQNRSNAPIYIDIEKATQSIGISTEDYNTFLTEYIDTALALEEDLKGEDEGKRTAAIHTLFHLSNVLRIPVITEIIEQLKYTETEDINSSIESFYATLSRLTTTKPETIQTPQEPVSVKVEEEKSKVQASETEAEAEAIEAVETEVVEEEPTPEAEEVTGFGTVDLSDVKPIHFDFRVEEAADDLSLPAELIEEFIHDFIKQAHEETDKMLAAYKKGDLDAIQKIGHLLKGTASNLRINPLADTLYEIQFCDDPSKLDGLIKEYWAHFIAFETQFNLQSQH